MGSCFTKSNIVPCGNKNTKRISKKNSQYHSRQNPNTSKLFICREEILCSLDSLNNLYNKIEEQAKSFIKQYKRGKGIFSLKRLRLYSNMQQDLEEQLKIVEDAIVQEELTFEKTEKIIQKTDTLLAEAKEIISLSGPLKEGESSKERELKLKCLFKKHHIETADIYRKFAEYEAEVNDITLTNSATFKQSDVTTQPSSLNFLED